MIGRMLAVVLAGLLLTVGAKAQSYTKLFSFCGQSGCADGRFPQYGLIGDAAGNFYGSSDDGGASGRVFRLSPDGSGGWTYSVLYVLCSKHNCLDGSRLSGPLILDTAGNLYGTTTQGGRYSAGVAFKLTPHAGQWTSTTLHSFCKDAGCTDGNGPFGGLSYLGQRDGLAYDGVSALYGATQFGSVFGHGVVFRLTPGPHWWQHRTIHSFCPEIGNCPFTGGNPTAGVRVDSANTLYGTTSQGGASLSGTVFKLTRSKQGWSQQVLHSFCAARNCADGQTPGALVENGAGELFGGTQGGPRTTRCLKRPCGTIFKLVPATGALTTLHTFCSEADCADGAAPGPLTLLANGDLVGVAQRGGILFTPRDAGHGTVFRLSGTTLDVLHAFCSAADCTDGNFPAGVVAADAQGRLFGTTTGGGDANSGVIWEIEP